MRLRVLIAIYLIGLVVYINSEAVAQDAIPEAKTLVTIHLKDQPAELAAQEISKLTGFNVSTSNAAVWRNAGSVTLDADNQPFWVVMQDFARQTGLSVSAASANTDSSRILLVGGTRGQGTLPQYRNGAFLFVAMNATRTHSVEYNRPDNVGSGSVIRIGAYVDPQLTLAGATPRFDVTEAIDEKGNSLARPARTDSLTSLTSGLGVSSAERWWYDLSAPLNYLPEQGKMLKSLKGIARFMMVSKEDVWKIAELADAVGAERTFPGGKYTVMGLAPFSSTGRGNPQEGVYTLRIGIDLDAPPAPRGGLLAANPYFEPIAIRRSIRVFDGAGRELSSRGYSSSSVSVTRREMGLTLNLSGPASDVTNLPSRMEWNISLETREIEVPVEFTNLPLP